MSSTKWNHSFYELDIQIVNFDKNSLNGHLFHEMHNMSINKFFWYLTINFIILTTGNICKVEVEAIFGDW